MARLVKVGPCGIINSLVDIASMVIQTKFHRSLSFTNIHFLACFFFCMKWHILYRMTCSLLFYLFANLFLFILTTFPSCIYGQEVQFCPHFDMHLKYCFGYFFWESGTFALIKFSLRFFCLLKAINSYL